MATLCNKPPITPTWVHGLPFAVWRFSEAWLLRIGGYIEFPSPPSPLRGVCADVPWLSEKTRHQPSPALKSQSDLFRSQCHDAVAARGAAGLDRGHRAIRRQSFQPAPTRRTRGQRAERSTGETGRPPGMSRHATRVHVRRHGIKQYRSAPLCAHVAGGLGSLELRHRAPMRPRAGAVLFWLAPAPGS